MNKDEPIIPQPSPAPEPPPAQITINENIEARDNSLANEKSAGMETWKMQGPDPWPGPKEDKPAKDNS